MGFWMKSVAPSALARSSRATEAEKMIWRELQPVLQPIFLRQAQIQQDKVGSGRVFEALGAVQEVERALAIHYPDHIDASVGRGNVLCRR